MSEHPGKINLNYAISGCTDYAGFSGTDPSGGDAAGAIPFIDTHYFNFQYGDPDGGERVTQSDQIEEDGKKLFTFCISAVILTTERTSLLTTVTVLLLTKQRA